LKEGITTSNMQVTELLANALASLGGGIAKGIPMAPDFSKEVIAGHYERQHYEGASNLLVPLSCTPISRSFVSWHSRFRPGIKSDPVHLQEKPFQQ
jgi:hypothetical protein